MGEIVGNIDAAQVVLYAFWIFFAGLVWYLQAEGRREGFPLEDEMTGEWDRDNWLLMPTPKVFKLPHGMGDRIPQDPANRDTRPVPAMRMSRAPGSALVPTSENPMLDPIGPASWAERPDHPDMTPHGTAKIQPLRVATDFAISPKDVDPRGLPVFGADGLLAGTISDVWVDQTENYIRYLQIDLGDTERLIPLHFAVQREKGGILGGGPREYYVHNLTAKQFGDVPVTKSPDEITMLEEEKIMGYYGGGGLYALPGRSEPIL